MLGRAERRHKHTGDCINVENFTRQVEPFAKFALKRFHVDLAAPRPHRHDSDQHA